MLDGKTALTNLSPHTKVGTSTQDGPGEVTHSTAGTVGIIASGENSLRLSSIQADIESIPQGSLDTYSEEIFLRLHHFMIQTMLCDNKEIIYVRKKIIQLIVDAVEKDDLRVNIDANPRISATTNIYGRIFTIESKYVLLGNGKMMPQGGHDIFVPFVGEENQPTIII